jgi:hypothetical protein
MSGIVAGSEDIRHDVCPDDGVLGATEAHNLPQQGTSFISLSGFEPPGIEIEFGQISPL